jgi:hypothetical protein
MAVNVCSTCAGYPQTPPAGVTYNYDRPNLITADAGMTIPHHPITKIQYTGPIYTVNACPTTYQAGRPGQASTPYYNVVTGKNDLAMIITASSTHTTTGHEPWRVINLDVNEQWWSLPGLYDAAGLYIGAQPEGGEWVKIAYPYPICVNRYVMILYAGTTAFVASQPKRWKVMGTPDGTTWEVIEDRTLVDFNWTWPWDGQNATTAVVAAKRFKEVKIIFTKVAPNQDYVTLACTNITGCQMTGTH